MKTKLLSIIVVSFLFSAQVFAAVMQGGVTENSFNKYNRITDVKTQAPISNAKVSIPQLDYTTYTDSNGRFALPANVRSNTILSVEKQDYRPFSITITDKNSNRPLNLAIEKSNKFDIKIDNNIYHIGDNNYSMASANAYEFRSRNVGPVYRKMFFMPYSVMSKSNYLVIGSIIGIDTALARGMGQNSITNAYASPPSIFFNGKKIAEIKINGDNQRIRIPNNLIKPNSQNEIKISAGINLKQTAYIDFDDIEFMNLNIE